MNSREGFKNKESGVLTHRPASPVPRIEG